MAQIHQQRLTATMWAAILRRDTLPSFSFTQPWGSLVVAGAKHYETRSWGRRYTGPLVIHASKTLPDEAIDACYGELFQETLRQIGYQENSEHAYNPWSLETGVILGIGWLARVTQITRQMHTELSRQEKCFGNFTPGRYAWHFTHVYRLQTPQPARGHLGIWQWQPSEAATQEFQSQLDLALTTAGGHTNA